MASNPNGSPGLTADMNCEALQKESPLLSVIKEALPIAPEDKPHMDAMNGEADIAQPLSIQKPLTVPEALINDVASHRDNVTGSTTATELQPSISSTVLPQNDTPTMIRNATEFCDLEIDLDVR